MIAVTRPIPEPGISILRRAGHRVRVRRSRVPPTERDLIRLLRGAEGAIALLTDPLTRRVLDAATRLRALSMMAVGVDNVDLAACRRRGIVVTNTPGVLADATADLTWALILAVARRVCEAERDLRAGRFRAWDPTGWLGMELGGKTLGVVGWGGVGRAVARRARGFGMRVLRHRGVPLARLLRESDVVTLHVPLTSKTRRLIGTRELSRMKPGAILINTARGPVIDEDAVAKALRSGRLGGLGLDVYEGEPVVRRSLLRAPRTVLLPHIGSATRETRSRMAEMAARQVATALAGGKVSNVVVG